MAQAQPPAIVIYGDETHQKAVALERALDALLPPDVDRALALTVYEGTENEEQGGPTFALVADDLSTLPLLTDRRVVVIRDADRFISASRERLERFFASPPPTGTLVLECRSFPRTTRLYKAIAAVDGKLIECKKLTGRGLVEFVMEEARARRKRMDYATAARICALVGQDQGMLAGEVEKLALYATDRPAITAKDVAELVGQSREEKVFAVMDAAAAGRAPEALRLWYEVCATDPAAVYKAVGGIGYVLRRWLLAHRLAAERVPVKAIVPKVMMWGREELLATLLRRLPPTRLQRLLAALAELDSQAKSGTRSIERGVEGLVLQVAAPAT
ncbi:MAG: DNA polymerase III subunit delta [Phycisphaerae bacterium]|jgi:DNA polymerase-3 subunit delta